MNEADEARWPGAAILAALPASQAGCITVDQLAAATGLTNDRITRIVTGLNKGGMLTMVRVGCYRRTAAGDALIASGKVQKSGPKGAHGKPRKVGGLKDKLWSALRIKQRATIPQLLEVIDHDIAEPADLAQKYLRQLAAAGVTISPRRRVAGEAPTSNGHRQHVLIHNLGPRAPTLRAGKLWDPNSGKWVAELLALKDAGAGNV